MTNEPILDGARKEGQIKGYSETINSKNIVSFLYNGPNFHLECELIDNKINIKSRGGYSTTRDGKYFKLDYVSTNLDFLKQLQELVEKYNLSKNNGYFVEVAGLPAGLGGRLDIKYESGENIFKSSNQFPILNEEEEKRIYELFHQSALDNGYDFNSKGSNVDLYNDATEEYLQGTWKGTHFGDEILVEIENNHIKIYSNNKLIDDIDYIIYEGSIRPNKLVAGRNKATTENDYETFKELSYLRKKNEILLTAYFTKENYSTCELLKQK